MEKYDSFLRDLTLRLKALGAKVKGNSYYFLEDGNWGILNIQKSSYSTSALVKFTINLGVSLTSLGVALDNRKASTKPLRHQWHWENRIGTYLPERDDKWWIVTEETDATDATELCNEVYYAIVRTGLPQIKMRCGNGYLQKEWMAGRCGHIGPAYMNIFLTTLLKLENSSELPRAIEQAKVLEQEISERIKLTDPETMEQLKLMCIAKKIDVSLPFNNIMTDHLNKLDSIVGLDGEKSDGQ